MEHGYSIIMAVFAGAILLYAGLMALTKNYNILPVRARQSVKPNNPKEYMAKFAKVTALVSLSPALSALAALLNLIAGLAVFIGSMILFIWIGTKIMKN